MRFSEQDTLNLLVELIKECVILLKAFNQVCPLCRLERLQTKRILDSGTSHDVIRQLTTIGQTDLCGIFHLPLWLVG